MRKIVILTAVALLSLVGNASADELRLQDFTIAPGETKTISVELNSPTRTYVAFEFFMTLPKGITIDTDKDGYLEVTLNSSRINGHQLEVAQDEDGAYHFLCYSSKNKAIKGDNGEILSITLTADNSLKGNAILQGRLFDQILTDTNKNGYAVEDSSFNIIMVGDGSNGILQMQDFTIVAGGKKTVSVMLNSSNCKYIAFEFFMTLPNGVAIDLDKNGNLNVTLNSSRSNGHTLEVEKDANGSYHFLCYSARNNAFKGSEGEILSISFTADASLVENTILQGLVYNLVLSDTDKNEVVQDNSTFDITISSEQEGLLGDVNNDKLINMSDVTATINYILGKPVSIFIFKNADVKVDGLINMSDVTGIINKILGKN